MKKTRITHATLVYQGALANVIATRRFACKAKRERLLQADFKTCEAFAKGLEAAGVRLESMACNLPGNILNSDCWTRNLTDAPFSGSFSPVGDCGDFKDRMESPGVYDELNDATA